MNSIFISLLWKEWHEHKWKLAAITAILAGVTSLTLLASDRDRFDVAAGMMLITASILAIFVGAGTAASEPSHNTLRFLRSLPVPLRQAAAAKLLFGALTIVVPICVVTLSFYLWRMGFDVLGVRYSISDSSFNWYLNVAAWQSVATASLWLWSAAAGVTRKDEISAAAWALAVVVGWWFVIFWTSFNLKDAGFDPLAFLLWGLAPTALPPDLQVVRGFLPFYLLLAIATCAGLIAWYVRRFGNLANEEVRSPTAAAANAGRTAWLAPPRRSAAAAIAWKQFRESGPVAVAGLVGIAGISLLLFFMQGSEARLATVYAGASASLGFCVAVVSGIGIALHDVRPQLSTFWRSRPIRPDLWFWMKYVSGLSMVLIVIYAPLWILVAWSERPVFDREAAITLPLLHMAAFAAAVATTCLVRHAVYAAVLSIAAIFAAIHIVWLVLLVAPRFDLPHLTTARTASAMNDPVAIGAGLLLCLLASTIVGWLAMRNDWGWKSRY